MSHLMSGLSYSLKFLCLQSCGWKYSDVVIVAPQCVCLCTHMPGAEGLVNLGEGSTTELHPQVQDRLSSAEIVIMD